MKPLILTLLLIFSILPLPTSAAQESTAFRSGPYLTTTQNGALSLTDNVDEAFVLKGVSTDNFLEAPSVYYTDGSIKTLKSWGGNVMRICFVPSYWQDDTEGIMDYDAQTDRYVLKEAEYRRKLEKLFGVMDTLIANEMYAIVNWHTLYPGYYNGHLLYTHQDLARQFFIDVATRYPDCPYVLYEINNEDTEEWTKIAAYADFIIPAIRAISKDAMIIVGTPAMDGCPNQVPVNPGEEGFLNYHNLMYGLHLYPGDKLTWKTANFFEAFEKGIPVIVTEWSTCGGGAEYRPAVGQRLLQLLKEYRVSSCWYSWMEVDMHGNEFAIAKAGQWRDDLPDEVLCDNGRFLRDALRNYDFPTEIDADALPEVNRMTVIRSGSSIWSDEYKNKITSVRFEDRIDIPDGAIVCDLGAVVCRDVKGVLVRNERSTPEKTYYDLRIQSNGKIYANQNCSRLFQNFQNLADIDFTNFVMTPETTTTAYMFGAMGVGPLSDASIVKTVSVKLGDEFDTSGVTSKEALISSQL